MKFLLLSLLLVPLVQAQSIQQVAKQSDAIGDLIEESTKVECLEERARAFTLDLGSETTEEIGKFKSITSGIPVACGGGAPKDGYDELYIIDCLNRSADQTPIFSGFRVRNGPGHPYFKQGGAGARQIDLVSRDSAFNETYLFIADTAGGADSEDVKSIMLLLPRKTPPKMSVRGNELHVTLPTGEKVVFDKTSHAILSGSLTEGAPDFRRDRHTKSPPNVHYSGAGISIRLNHRFLDPTLSADAATVVQSGRSCQVPRTALYDDKGKLRSQSDSQLLGAINKSCPVKAGQSPFHL
jgi:hypothetical protein